MRNVRQPRQAGLFVREARLAHGLTQRQLAERAGVSERSVLALEMGDAPGIRLDKLLSILDALGAEMELRSDADSATDAVGPVEAAAVPSPTPAPVPMGMPVGTLDASVEYQRLYATFVRRAFGECDGGEGL